MTALLTEKNIYLTFGVIMNHTFDFQNFKCEGIQLIHRRYLSIISLRKSSRKCTIMEDSPRNQHYKVHWNHRKKTWLPSIALWTPLFHVNIFAFLSFLRLGIVLSMLWIPIWSFSEYLPLIFNLWPIEYQPWDHFLIDVKSQGVKFI